MFIRRHAAFCWVLLAPTLTPAVELSKATWDNAVEGMQVFVMFHAPW